MNPEFWLENWKNNKTGFHQQEFNPYLTAFWQKLEVEPTSSVFVPLCGKSLDLVWLRQQGHSVLGVEISEIAVKQFFSENQIAYRSIHKDDFNHYLMDGFTLLHGDFFNISAERVQDVSAVFDRAALVALPPELRQKYVQRLNDILPANVKILLVTFEYDQTQMTGPPFSVPEDEVNMLYKHRYYIDLLLKQEVLEAYAAFQALGLDYLQEKVYVLTPR